ncbi:hypothetical protein tb265_36080 [Gemmatimonadetes bacterium T265]|nr:hypothetical protein tb265_36080 [Gemmatimonadetes bacterium T265]
MLFRGRQPAASVWRRFRSDADEFTVVADDAYVEVRVAANAERAVDLLYALSEQLPPAVDVWIEDVRAHAAWRGVNVPLPDVREAIARLKVPLAAYGGVEFAVYNADDQLTLAPDLTLYVYARSDRWIYVLQSFGLIESSTLAGDGYQLAPDELGDAPELADALVSVAERLGLVGAGSAGSLAAANITASSAGRPAPGRA